MAVALRGYTALSVASSPTRTFALPVGTAVGDLCLVNLFEGFGNDVSMRSPGYAYLDRRVWYKYLTAADVSAGSVAVTARGGGLVVLSGAAGVVRSRQSKSSLPTVAGGAVLWVAKMSGYYSGDPTTSALALGATVVEADGWRHRLAFSTAPVGGTLTLDGVHRDASTYSFTVTPPATPPAPIVSAPPMGASLDRTAVTTVRLAHQGMAPMDSVRVAVRAVSTSPWQWVQSAGTLTAAGAATVDLVNSTGEVTIAAAALTGGVTYELQAFTHDVTGWSPGSTVRTFTARTPPSAVATLTTTAGDLSPLASWVTTAGTGSQTGWQVRVTPAAAATSEGPLYDTGLRPGAEASFELPNTIPWVNGGSYKAWVRVADSALIGVWAASTAKTVSWTPPTTPSTIALVQGLPPTIALTGLSVTASWVAIEWSLDGVVWTPVATLPGNGAATRSIPVPLAEYGVPRHYRARIFQNTDGVPLASAWRTIAMPVASTDRCSYLVDETDQSDYLKVDISADNARVDLEGVSVTSGLGATTSRVDYGVSAGVAGSTTFNTDTLAARSALESWLKAHCEPFWVRWPAERSGATYVNVPALLVARATPTTVERFAQYVVQHRQVSLAWVTR